MAERTEAQGAGRSTLLTESTQPPRGWARHKLPTSTEKYGLHWEQASGQNTAPVTHLFLTETQPLSQDVLA